MRYGKTTLALLLSVLVVVAGQLSLKKGLNSLGSINFSSGIIDAYLRIFLSPFVIVGIMIYCMSLLIWFYVLTKVDLSIAYPFLALSYVLVLLFSWLILGESISALRIVGVSVISCGVILVARS